MFWDERLQHPRRDAVAAPGRLQRWLHEQHAFHGALTSAVPSASTDSTAVIAYNTRTVRRTDQPTASKRWWMCSRSGFAICRSVERIDRPSDGRAILLRNKAIALSAIGSAKISNGTADARAVAPFCHPVIAVAASRNPI